MTAGGSREAGAPEAAARARLTGKRAALVVVIGVAVAFIGASAAQIVPAVFGIGITPLRLESSDPSARACAAGIRSLAETTLEKRSQTPPERRMVGPSHPDDSGQRREEETIARACATSVEGLDAWAALMRLRSAQEQLLPGDYGELAPLRRDVATHLAADLR